MVSSEHPSLLRRAVARFRSPGGTEADELPSSDETPAPMNDEVLRTTLDRSPSARTSR